AAGGAARETLVPHAMSPTVSPDGRRLAFVLFLPEGPTLGVADADGKNAGPLLAPGRPGGVSAPRLSPDGKPPGFSAAALAGGPPAPDAPRAGSTRAGGAGGGGARAPAALPRPGANGPAPAPLAWLLPAVARAHGEPKDVFAVGADGTDLRRLAGLGEDD